MLMEIVETDRQTEREKETERERERERVCSRRETHDV